MICLKTNFSFKIEHDLPTLNEYIEAERSNKYAAAKIKNRSTYLCMICALNSLREYKLNGLYDICIDWFRNDRKDHDNIAFGIKFILDGLVESKILTNDNPTHIQDQSHKFHKIDKKEKNYCIITLTEIL